MKAGRDAGRDLFTCERFFREKYIDPDRAIAIAEFAPHWINRAVEAEKEVERLKKQLNFLVNVIKTGYRAGYIDGDGFGDALMDEIEKIAI